MKTLQTQAPDSLGAASGSAVLKRQIEETEAAIKPLAAKLETLRRQKRDVDSRDFISANRITRADVEMSSGDGKPWFGVCYDFGRWMRTHHCSKLWAEWNGRIYHAADLMADRMRETPGEVDHLPNGEVCDVPDRRGGINQ